MHTTPEFKSWYMHCFKQACTSMNNEYSSPKWTEPILLSSLNILALFLHCQILQRDRLATEYQAELAIAVVATPQIVRDKGNCLQEKGKEPPPKQPMRIVSYFGDWICECGTQNRLWDTCECGQAGPCRDWVRGRCKYAGACRYAISTGSHSGTSLVNQPFLSFRRAKCCPHMLCLTSAGQIDVTNVLWVGAGSRIRPSTCQQGLHLLRQLHVQHQVLSTLALCQPL